MESSYHSLRELFLQLGLAADTAAIETFIEGHRPLPAAVALTEAPFWTAAQRTFLCQQLEADADWAELVDQLDSRLR